LATSSTVGGRPRRYELRHVAGHAHGLDRVRQRAPDRLLDPPRRVGREAATRVGIELLGRLQEADVPFGDHVLEHEAALGVDLGDRHDQAQIGPDHVLACRQVSGLDAATQLAFLRGGQERDLVDLEQVGLEAAFGGNGGASRGTEEVAVTCRVSEA
jgi:hypothetical protein